MPYVCLYRDYLEPFRELSVQAVGRLVMAMLHYLDTGEEPKLTGYERILWPGMREKMLRDQNAYAQRCERSRVNGAKGGRPKKEKPGETSGIILEPEKGNKNNNDNDNENENKNENKNENNNKNKNNINNKNENQNPKKNADEEEATGAKPSSFAAEPPRPRFIRPTLEEVKDFCKGKAYRQGTRGRFSRDIGTRVGT